VAFLAVNNFGDTRSGGLAGPMGLFIIVLLSIATVLLIRNMNKRLRRLPDSFEQPGPSGRTADLAGPGADPRRAGSGNVGTRVDEDRSVSGDGSTAAQVNDAKPGSGPAGTGGRAGGA
jgi:hypothetical protein